eukprot:TRINITY_DN2354_c0_g1_i1.p1 TRINITY_DN2354_c0_g1~~TRINITY_DN2354_c0_g1_i1.p1  ORF type:complete len:346 (-),score=96.48 TRINITY_DN2354_c0_g1_i1:365-1402(-)
MVEEEMKNKRVESLGWLTESSVMPKKHKAIEGVGVSSILELKAQLYKTQEEAKKAKDLAPDSAAEFHRAKKKIVPLDVFTQKNSGVDSRANRDKLELKAIKDGSVSYAALERKAELYDKLARGELPDEEEKEKYCVDFFRKSIVQDESEQPQGCATSPVIPLKNEEDDTNAIPLDAKLVGPGRTGNAFDNDEHKRFIREVHEDANQARDKESALKLRRKEQVAARREKLRKDYLRKQLEKLKAAKERTQGCATSPVIPLKNEEDDTNAIPLDAKLVGPGRTGNAFDNDEHKRFIREVHEDANQARDKESALKLRRKEQVAARREKLRKDYLRKQLEKLKAAKEQP